MSLPTFSLVPTQKTFFTAMFGSAKTARTFSGNRIRHKTSAPSIFFFLRFPINLLSFPEASTSGLAAMIQK